MPELIIRKIGNSVGCIFPKSLGLKVGDTVEYKKEGQKLVIDLEPINVKHDREIIEKSFADFEKGKWIDEDSMEKKFGKYGWGK